MNELTALLAPEFSAHLSGPGFYGILVLLGAVIGLMTGFFGVGGGFLTVPLLNVLLGVPYEIAVGSDLCFIIGTSISGFLRQAALGKVDYRALFSIAGGSMAGAVAGDVIQDLLFHTAAGGNRDRFTTIMHILFLLLLAGTAVIILRGSGRGGAGKKPLLQRISAGPKVDLSHPGLEGVSLIGMVLVGFLIGILTGVLGIGGGILMVPVLLVFVGLPADKAAGTSLGIIFLAALAGVVKKSLSGTPKISLPVTMALLVASVIGVQVGIKMVQNFDTGRFRRYFSIVVFGAIGLIIADLLFF